MARLFACHLAGTHHYYYYRLFDYGNSFWQNQTKCDGIEQFNPLDCLLTENNRGKMVEN